MTVARGVPCRHGNTACITARGVGTYLTRSANPYSGAGSVSGDLGVHGPRLTGAGPHVTGTAEPNLPEFLTPTFERPATYMFTGYYHSKGSVRSETVSS